MEKIKNFCLSIGGTHSKIGDFGLLMLRVVFGLTMAFSHGMGKTPPSDGFINVVAQMGFPFPTFFAWMASLSESIGGILIACGLLTRPAAFLLLQTMLVAAFMKHAGDPFSKMESALLFASFCFAILMTGAGQWSLDAYFWKQSDHADNTTTP